MEENSVNDRSGASTGSKKPKAHGIISDLMKKINFRVMS